MTAPKSPSRPLIAITPDLLERNGHETIRVTSAYARRVGDAGGLGVVVPPIVATIPDLLARFDGFVFTGGDDPKTEPFGEPTHPKTTPVHPVRQLFETELLAALKTEAPERPVLGVCLGMQMMALACGGSLDQYMPDTTPTHAEHWESNHMVVSEHGYPSGEVRSKHHQAVRDPGSMRVVARAHDGVIEAIDDPSRAFFVGVQWHPERTGDPVMGQWYFDRLVESCRR
ncbi:MAG: type 1 glutamine amidotransferase [Phycisphaerales bacterium]|nr:type 1 glutamine amidotransferase [Phycisphaerales bacterium]